MAEAASNEIFTCPVSREIWESKYQYRDGGQVYDHDITDSWKRLAAAAAGVEADRELWASRFYDLLTGFKFLPGGRILAGAGTHRHVTLFNCFVMGPIEDSVDGIFDALKEGAITMQQGGGVGYDFSTLRPAGTYAHSVGNIASGPVSFMRIWDSMCATILSTGARRGAMMATLRCDHPDIMTFIEAKQDRRELRHFNLSVQISDDFMAAVSRDGDWPLVFPAAALGERRVDDGDDPLVQRVWSGSSNPVPCRVIRVVKAKEIWQRLMQATYDFAEPGVLFIDRINRDNPLWYRETISATNPCGEVPLPPYGACNLGSLNLVNFVRHPFTVTAGIDLDGLERAAKTAVRLLDNVIDISHYPLPAQREQAVATRRIGLGITGLADLLMMLGLAYDSEPGRQQAAAVVQAVCHAAYRTSIELAEEKGSFPFFRVEDHLRGSFVSSLPVDIRTGIKGIGLRNSHLLAIAPTGSISVLANNVSSGIEPVFGFRHHRRIVERNGEYACYEVDDYAWRLWSEQHAGEPVPPHFGTARDVHPIDHLKMQAALQPYVDQAISKTINVAGDFSFADFNRVYRQAYDLGLKGCTTFRPNPVTGEILSVDTQTTLPANVHCCGIEREGD